MLIIARVTIILMKMLIIVLITRKPIILIKDDNRFDHKDNYDQEEIDSLCNLPEGDSCVRR